MTTLAVGSLGTTGDSNLAVNPPAPSGGNGGATAQGITATSINLGEVISRTGPVSGQWEGIIESAQAYANYVNSLGGIYGRKIHISIGDDQYDVVKDKAVCQSLVPNSFALVSNFNLGDAGCYPLLQSTGIPEISSIVFDPQLATLPNVFAPIPDYYSNLEVSAAKALHPDLKKVWIVEENQPGIAAQEAPEAHAWESIGVQPVNVALLPANAPSYTSEVVQAKNAGAQAVDCFSCALPLLAQVAQEIQQQGWSPEWKQGYAPYNTAFGQLAGSASQGWETGVTVPVLDLQALQATPGGKLYLQWAGNPAKQPNPSPTTYGWIDMAEFVQAAVLAGPDLTWPKLESALKTLTGFTADGLQPPTASKGSNPNGCITVVQNNGGTNFSQIFPATAGHYACGGQLFH